MNKILAFFFYFLFVGFSGNAQIVDSLAISKKNKIAFVPQVFLFEGIKVEYEMKISETQAITFAPQLYLRQRYETDSLKMLKNDYYKSLYGVGLDILHTLYFSKSSRFRTYFSYGVGYNYFQIKQLRQVWYKTTFSGIEVYKLHMEETTQSINSFAGKAVLGLHLLGETPFYIDIYAGVGVRKSFNKFDSGQKIFMFTDKMWQYGYSGTQFLVGAKVGIAF